MTKNENLEPLDGDYADCELRIDGKSLVECSLHNVTLVYNGGDLHMEKVKISGNLRIRTESRQISRFMHAYEELGLNAAWQAEVKQEVERMKDEKPTFMRISDTSVYDEPTKIDMNGSRIRGFYNGIVSDRPLDIKLTDTEFEGPRKKRTED